MSSLKSSEKPKKKPYKWRRKPKKNADWYAEWGANQTDCHCCGIAGELAAHVRYPGLSTHHIAKAGRVHTATNVLRLCQRCHDLAENLDTPVWLPDGTKWYFPKLTFAHCHWLKLNRSPKEYDAETLKRLRMGVLDEPEEPPAVFRAEYVARTRHDLERAAAILKTDPTFPGELRDLLLARMQPK